MSSENGPQTEDFEVWVDYVTGLADGARRPVRYLVTRQELLELLAAGVVSTNARRVIGVQEAAQVKVAIYEKEIHEATGGLLQ